MEVLLEKELLEEERKEIRRQIEDKYNPSTIVPTYGAGGAGADFRRPACHCKARAGRFKDKEKYRVGSSEISFARH